MILRFSTFALLLASSCSAKQEELLPLCPRNSPSIYETYHAVDKCNHAWQTSDARRQVRSQRHEHLGKSGQYSLIAPQKTVVCPLDEPVDLATPIIGQDTRWIVENKASTPVVLAFVQDGVEMSAMNGNIVPPQADPDAIMQPGQVKFVNTYEGHVFYARELLPDGSVGDVLLQHRPGIVEFTNRFGQELDCGASIGEMQGDGKERAGEEIDANKAAPTQSVADTCSVDGTSATSADNDTQEQSIETPSVLAAAQPGTAKATPSHPNQCNIIYQGFRNTLPNCPLDIYFAGSQQGIPSNGPMHCHEQKKFPLGIKPLNSTLPDESQLKFEVTYVGHSFVARLASNPNIVVDSYTVQPTEIHDCPRRKSESVTVEQVVGEIRIPNGAASLQNGTATIESGDNDNMEAIHAALACHETNSMNDLSR